MKKSLTHKLSTVAVLILLLFNTAPVAHAQVLPKTIKSRIECEKLLDQSGLKQKFESGSLKRDQISDILGCSIKTGDINLWMVPFFITYLINFILALAGLICVLFIVLGGYWYIIGSAQGQTDKGKNTIIYAIVGLVITLMAWILVNIVQSAVT